MSKIRKFTNQDLKLSEMDRQSLNNLLLPLLRLRQSCCHPQAVKGKLFLKIINVPFLAARHRPRHGGGVVVIRTPVRPNSNSAEFRAWVVLNYSSYVVLG